jgi:hypothetical protein
MMKAGILEEMIEDTMEGLEGEEEEEAAQAEIDRIMFELTAGALGTAPDALKGERRRDHCYVGMVPMLFEAACILVLGSRVAEPEPAFLGPTGAGAVKLIRLRSRLRTKL